MLSHVKSYEIIQMIQMQLVTLLKCNDCGRGTRRKHPPVRQRLLHPKSRKEYVCSFYTVYTIIKATEKRTFGGHRSVPGTSPDFNVSVVFRFFSCHCSSPVFGSLASGLFGQVYGSGVQECLADRPE